MLFVLRKFVHYTYRPLLQWYLKKPRTYRWRSTIIEVDPGVFHPGLFKSTLVMLEYLETVGLQHKTLLELGCGTGLISIVAAKRGATATASDISTAAVQNAKRNARNNDVPLETWQSDLFTNTPQQPFDFVIINPPFYPSDPVTEEEQAWYCGTDHSYFKRLFHQLQPFIARKSQILMVLSSDCNQPEIQDLLTKNNLSMKALYQKKFLFEEDSVYLIL